MKENINKFIKLKKTQMLPVATILCLWLGQCHFEMKSYNAIIFKFSSH